MHRLRGEDAALQYDRRFAHLAREIEVHHLGVRRPAVVRMLVTELELAAEELRDAEEREVEHAGVHAVGNYVSRVRDDRHGNLDDEACLFEDFALCGRVQILPLLDLAAGKLPEACVVAIVGTAPYDENAAVAPLHDRAMDKHDTWCVVMGCHVHPRGVEKNLHAYHHPKPGLSKQCARVFNDSMIVVMLKVVKGVGQRGKVIEVSDGYALNSLIPQGKAVHATAEKLAQVEKQMANASFEKAKHDAELATKIRSLDGKQVVVKARANEQGHLYKKLGLVELAADLVAYGPIDPSMLSGVGSAITAVGEHVIHVAAAGVEATVKVVV